MVEKHVGNKSKDFFRNITLIAYISGLPNIWIEDLALPTRFMKIHDKFCKVFNYFLFVYVFVQVLSVFTQHNLTEKQKNYQLMFCIGHPFVVTFPTLMTRHQHRMRRVLLEMIVDLKQIHNDLEVEKQMIKQIKAYSLAVTLPFWISMVSYCVDSYVQVLKTGTTFNVMILAWPLVDDYSMLASVARVLYHIIWVLFETRVTATYMVVISLTACVSHQYKNLQSYFGTLEPIFFDENLTQAEKERKYENMLKIGIQAHSDTLSITKYGIEACRGVLSAQVLFNIVFLVLLMYSAIILNENRSLVKLFSTFCTVTTLLFGTWFFMCNAGDVTHEAALVATAMYTSGWQNCTGVSSGRIRKLLVIAISRAQQPVVLKGFGIMTLSHQAFLTIVKFSYSIFSLLY